MTLDIPFGDSTVSAEVPDRTFIVRGGGQKRQAQPLPDLGAAIESALANPLESARIQDTVSPDSRVVIAFDDATVPCFGPVRGLAIKAIMQELANAGVPPKNVSLICANSLHRKFRRDELAVILGQDIVDEFGDRLSCHDAEDTDGLSYFGKTPENGYDVEISRAAAEADLCVYVCAAQNRGFSGGWKSVCVGLSSFRSIRHHHTPDGMSMSVRDNRMHRVLDEMGAHLRSECDTKFFKIDCIEANPFETSHVFAGDTDACRAAVLEVLQDLFPARASLSEDRYDAVLYGVPNWSPYAIFAKMNPILTLVSSGLGYLGGAVQALGKPGCTIVMATPCPDQWDDVHHPSYRHVWENVLPESLDPYEIENRFTDAYVTNDEFVAKYRDDFAFHPVHGILATHPLRRLKHAGRVIVAGIEDPAVAEHLGFDSAPSVEEALEMVAEEHGADYSLAYMQHPASQATKLAM